ncbi:hypothetical protein CIB84_004395 [Bambusicola thoracicus]|uniref:Tudor domain-containing protein n=1 Tax=Bambusicola thoracicus TaxID=9083 RepID=A0A2P4T664_BAMTH|nr:hypothetical protein CIB84_004395 [Bambusicola thoracicus]
MCAGLDEGHVGELWPLLYSSTCNARDRISSEFLLGVWFQHSVAVVIRLQGLLIVVGTMDFSALTIPDGGKHIVGGELGIRPWKMKNRHSFQIEMEGCLFHLALQHVRYPAHIEEIDYEEGKVLIHFKRWNHRYDEWFCWDSPYLRPLEKIQLRKEGLHEEEGCAGFHINDQVLACWSDCRFYPAKVTSVNKDGTYTVKFYDGVVQTVKNIHVKAFSKDQNIVGNAKPKERGNEIPSSPEKREKFKEQRKATGNAKKDKDEKTLKTEKRVKQPDKEGKLIVSEKGKVSEKNISKNGKEDKENISENDMEYSIDTQIEKKPENDNVKSPQENVKETKRKRGRPPITPPTEPGSQTLQPIALELRRRKIPKGGEVPSKRPRIDRNLFIQQSCAFTIAADLSVLAQEKLKNSSDNHEKDQIRRRSSRLSSGVSHEILNADHVATSTEVQTLKDTVSNPKESEKGKQLPDVL